MADLNHLILSWLLLERNEYDIITDVMTKAEGNMKLVEAKSTLNHTTAIEMMNARGSKIFDELMFESIKFQDDEVGYGTTGDLVLA